jgi:protocatechuate 3,4-dioxygenase beta subunit
VELSGITLSGKEVALMLVNLATNDFILTFDFIITSYFPSIFGEVPVPANLNVNLYLVPPKPSFNSDAGGFSQVSFNANRYQLSFTNESPVPLSGKFQVGVMKGNFLSDIGFCDPNCVAPIDSGIATFVRINLGAIAGIQVIENENVFISPGTPFAFTVDNPELRSNEKSAFIIRWTPDYTLTPYLIHTTIAGIESTKEGQFSSHTLTTVKKIAYNLVRDFGYVGSAEFTSPDMSTFLTLSTSTSAVTEGTQVQFSGRLTDLSGIGIPNAQVFFQDEDTLSRDEYLGSSYTDSDGGYSYAWTARNTDFIGNTMEIFASYKGSSSSSESRSKTVALQVADYSPPKTYLTITSSSRSGYEGESIEFTGRLSDENGDAVASKLVYLQDEDTLSGDEYLGSSYTDNYGNYHITWNVEDTDFLGSTLELFVSYPGSSSYGSARSQTLSFDVLSGSPEPTKVVTEISFESSANSAYEGETILFTGILITDEGDAVSNALIYIKDEDTGSGDDELGTLTTGSDGSFDFYWDARATDPLDNKAEVYAVFEGNAFYESARSQQVDITVYDQSSLPQEGDQFQTTTLGFMTSSTSVNEGDVVTLSGSLVGQDGFGVGGATIYIKDEDAGSGDDLIVMLATDSDGDFSFDWLADQMDPLDDIVEIYAVFEGSSLYGQSRSAGIDVTVS